MAIWMQIRALGFGDQNIPQSSLTAIIVLLSLALYNVIELICIILGSFKRYAGVYFWSCVVATLGILLSCSGFFVKFFGSSPLAYLSCTLSTFGWVFMVTGQSMVLWSRLHLVLQNEKRLTVVLWIIVINAVIINGTIIPMVYGTFSSNSQIWAKPYSIAEKVELVLFFLQEVMLSTLYIVQTVALMRLTRSVGHGGSSHRLMKHLILVNVLVIILDITIVGLEFENQYDLQIAYKPFAYSVKLKLEFTVLNRLVDLATRRWEMTVADGISSISAPAVHPISSEYLAGRSVASLGPVSCVMQMPRTAATNDRQLSE